MNVLGVVYWSVVVVDDGGVDYIFCWGGLREYLVGFVRMWVLGKSGEDLSAG